MLSSASNLAKFDLEHVGQLARLGVVRLGVGPREPRLQQARLDARHGDRHLEAEDRIGPILDAGELARDRGPEQRARRLDRHPLALAEHAARPARVHEPDACAVLVEPLRQQARVDDRRLRQERGAEAGGEGRLRLLDADLGAGELGGEAGEEPVHRLVARQARDRRQDPEGVRGEEDHRLRMAGALRRQRVRDLLELVGGAGVLGLRAVVEVDDAALVEDDVLEDRPERARRLVDLGLGLGGEIDHLRVAAALEVEDAVVAPAVLVVADQRPLRIGRERGLAGAGEAEEDRHVVVGRRRSPSSASGRRPRAAAGRSSA